MGSRPIGISLATPPGSDPRSWCARSPRGRTWTCGSSATSACCSAPRGDRRRGAARRARAGRSLRWPCTTSLPGQPSTGRGRAQLAYLAAAVDAALAGEIGALVTAPISKEWIARAGFTHPGHTEYLAARAGVTDFAMMLAGPKLRVVLATTHVALRDVADVDRPRQHRATPSC